MGDFHLFFFFFKTERLCERNRLTNTSIVKITQNLKNSVYYILQG